MLMRRLIFGLALCVDVPHGTLLPTLVGGAYLNLAEFPRLSGRSRLIAQAIKSTQFVRNLSEGYGNVVERVAAIESHAGSLAQIV